MKTPFGCLLELCARLLWTGAIRLVSAGVISGCLALPVLGQSGGPPVFVTQPLSQEVQLTSNVTLTAVTAGAKPQAFQWMFQGTNLPGKTSTNLALTRVLIQNLGDYRLVASNALGVVTSAVATIRMPSVVGWGIFSGPTNVPVLGDVAAIAAGGSTSYALKADGTVVGWGDNSYGQTKIPAGVSNVISLAAGQGHCVALKADGKVVAWGYNPYKQTNVPTGLSNVVAIAAGGSESVALRADGKIIMWGMVATVSTNFLGSITNATTIAAGANHILILRADSTVAAWGNNYYGETNVPPGLTNVVAIAAGFYHSMALRADGSVVAWGDNTLGATNVPVGLSNVIAIAGGTYHSLALKNDGTVVTWGRSLYGALPVPSWLNHVVAIAGGEAHSLGLTGNGGPLISAQPAGWSGYSGADVTLRAGVLGTGITVQWLRDGVPIDGATNLTLKLAAVTPAQSGSYRLYASNSIGTALSGPAVVSVADKGPVIVTPPQDTSALFGSDTSLGVLVDGSLPRTFQWALNGSKIIDATNATLAINNTRRSSAGSYQVVVSNAFGVVTSQVANVSVLYVTAWGANWNGQTNVPAGLDNVVSIAAGSHSLAVHGDGTVVGWGSNWYGETNVPPNVQGTIVAVAAGDSHTLALKDDGSVVAWGEDNYGQAETSAAATNVVAIAAGFNHNLALRSDGIIVAWGRDTQGQTEVPPGINDATAIGCGMLHSLAVRSDGSVVAWGLNASGQANVPTGLSNAVAVAGGYSHSLALQSNGLVVGWGDNSYGQVAVPSWLSNVVAISAGGDTSMALRSDGTVVAWGYAENDLTNFPQGLRSVLAISCGERHAMALLGDGAPAIITASQLVYSGNTLSLQCASALACHGYQWYQNGVAIDGATNKILILKNSLPAQSGTYTVTATNSKGPAASEPVQIQIVDAPPQITTQPKSQVARLGMDVMLTVSMSGSQPQYFQWLMNGTNLAGANDGVLRRQGVRDQDYGDYAVIISNAFGTVTSQVARVERQWIAAWGQNDFGQTNCPTERMMAVAVGKSHSLGLRSNGTVAVWGDNSHQQLAVPAAASNVIAIAAGDYHNLALRVDGTVCAWGENGKGQATVPDGLTNVVDIAAGSAFSLALRADGRVTGWGDNLNGQISVPNELTDAVAIGVAGNAVMAVRADGSVILWGTNHAMSLPAGLENVVAVGGSDRYGWALQADGLGGSWGYFNNGQIYLGAVVPADLPKISAMSAATQFSLALGTDGSVHSWGLQTNVLDWAGPAVAISAGDDHSLAALWDGSPVFLRQPVGTTISSGEAIRLKALVWGDGAKYQWFKDGTPIALATNSFLTLTNASTNQSGSYVLVASNALGVAACLPAPIKVQNVPTYITLEPVGQEVRLGGVATLSVRTAGSLPQTYKWFANGQPIPGATDRTLVISSVALSDLGRYQVLVSNAFGAVTSEVVVVRRPSVVAWGLDDYGQTDIPANLGEIVAIAAGPTHCLALRSNQTVVAWGSSQYGATNVPPGLSNVTALAAGQDFSMALKASGTVTLWGNAPTNYMPADLTNVVSIAASPANCMVLRRDGTVSGWDMLGLDTKVPAGLTDVVAIATSLSREVMGTVQRPFNLALKADGMVVGWGENSANQLNIPSGLSNVVAIATGDHHCLALRSDGRVVAWGWNFSYGESTVPPDLGNVVGISAGAWHSTALLSDGTTVGWGWAGDGQTTPPADAFGLVSVSDRSRYSMALVGNGSPVFTTRASARARYSGESLSLWVGVAGTGVQFQWFRNNVAIDGATNATLVLDRLSSGQSGSYTLVSSNAFGSTVSAPIPVTVTDASPIFVKQPQGLEVTIGDSATFTAKTSGSQPQSYQWFYNRSAIAGATNVTLTLTNIQLENMGSYQLIASNPFGAAASDSVMVDKSWVHTWGYKAPDSTGIPIGLGRVKDLSAGGEHTLAVRQDGTVAAWGGNSHGQRDVPPGLSNAVAVAAGWDHSVALRANGTVAAWGSNTYGQTNVPAGLSNVVSVVVGAWHNLALRADGTAVGWGENSWGEAAVPAGLSNLVAVAAGGAHSLVLRADGTLFGWGADTDGEASIPPGVSNVVAIAAGAWHTMALLENGTVAAWGNNADGQTNVPVGLSNVVAISAGQSHSLALRADGSLVAWGLSDDGQTTIPATLGSAMMIDAGAKHNVAMESDGTPTIILHPMGGTIYSGYDLKIRAVAGGVGIQGYQWRLNGVPVDGATNPVLTLHSGISSQSGNYTLAVSNSSGVTISRPAVVNVLDVPPQIGGQLSNSVTWLGDSIKLSLSVNGSAPCGFQWLFNGQAIAGATNATYFIRDLSADGLGRYQLVVSNAFGVATSSIGSVSRKWVVGWGSDSYGQATQPSNLSNVVAVASGDYHNLALRSDGTVMAWGANDAGQTNVPKGLSGCIKIAAGGSHSLALKNNGLVVAWGDDSYGQTNVPAGLSNVVAVAAGGHHSLALRSDGTTAVGFLSVLQKRVSTRGLCRFRCLL